jgi:hypothetical protein
VSFFLTVAAHRIRHVYTWTITCGLVADFDEPRFSSTHAYEGAQDLIAALQGLIDYPEDQTPTLFVFKDLHPYLIDPMIVR